jgi:dihydrodipicolinate synthase/N-acetylneuraminate lyase
VRARDAAEEIIAQASRVGAESIVVSLPIVSEAEQEPLKEMIRSVLENAPCEVLIKRIAAPGNLILNGGCRL